jgi:hypothetical protein
MVKFFVVMLDLGSKICCVAEIGKGYKSRMSFCVAQKGPQKLQLII